VEQLSPCAVTIELVFWSLGAKTTEASALQPVMHNKKRHCSEKPTYHNQRGATTRHNLRKARAAVKTQHDQNK